MPTYDYLCDACGHEFEEFQSISAGALRKCPECTKLKLRRLIGGGAGFLFKGSGFYETDYRSESYKKAHASDKAGAESPPSGDTPAKDGEKAKAAPEGSQAKGQGKKAGGNKTKEG